MNEILSKLLPTIATIIAGPLGGLAVEAIGSALGMTDATKEKVSEVLSNGSLSADQIAALKQAELNLQVKLKELDINLEDIKAKDRISARTLFVQGYKLIGSIAVLTILGFYVCVGYILKGGLKGMSPEELVIVGTVIGYLAANAQSVYNYFFGSSSGSDKKTDSLVDSIKSLGNGNGH